MGKYDIIIRDKVLISTYYKLMHSQGVDFLYIKRTNIENFTVFERFEMNAGKGINIFIGENGTGKTHLLKLMYAPFSNNNVKNGRFLWEELFTHNIDAQKSPNFFRRNIEKEFVVDIGFNNGINYVIRDGVVDEQAVEVKAVFIPATEMLSHSNGFLALERERYIPFDKTLIDIISKSQLGNIKMKSSFNNDILQKIANLIGGQVIYENDTFYILKESGLKVEFSMEAEGIRKIGLLWRLIKNGSIHKGSVLFWDEPEANINPKFVPELVEILLELQRNGVQIFITTHDYIFSKYFDVKSSDNDINYYSLYKTSQGVKYEFAKKLDDLENNQIRDTFIKLYEDEIERAMK